MVRRSRAASTRWLWRLLLVPLPFVMALPFLIAPSFSLIDDGVTLATARRMDTNEMRLKQDASGERHSRYWYIESEHGRVRPTYWWWLWFNYKLYGTNSGAWHLGVALSIALLLQLVYAISYRVTGSVLASMVAGGLIVAFHPYAEVFWRLGLGETPMLLLIGVSLLCMVRGYSLGPRVPRKKAWLYWLCFAGAVVPLGVAYFVKETSLVMLPTSVVMLLVLWRRKSDRLSKALLVGYVAANAVAAVALLAHVLPTLRTGDYSELYRYDLPGWSVGQFFNYLGTVGKAWSALPVLALAAMGVKLARSWRGGGLADEQRWQLVWLTCAAASIVVIAPWGGSTVAIARYLFPFAIFAALLIGHELAWLFTSARRLLAEPAKARDKYGLERVTLSSVAVFVVASLGVLAAANLPPACKATLDSARLEATNANLVQLLAAEAPRGRPLYANLTLDEEEIRYEIRLHLAMIHGRDDFGSDRSVKYLGHPDEPGIPEQFRDYMAMPEPGEWVLAPWRRYRSRAEIHALYRDLRPTRVFLVTAKGWEPTTASGELARKLQALKGAWVVLETGRPVWTGERSP